MNDRWDPVTGYARSCACQRCRELPNNNPPPYVSPEHSEDYNEEYYDGEYEMREDTPTQ